MSWDRNVLGDWVWYMAGTSLKGSDISSLGDQGIFSFGIGIKRTWIKIERKMWLVRIQTANQSFAQKSTIGSFLIFLRNLDPLQFL